MAKQMAYTKDDFTYPATVSFPVGIYVDFSGPSGNVVFNMYPDLTTATKALKHAVGIPGGKFVAPLHQHPVPLTAEQVQALAASAPVGADMITALRVPAYPPGAAYLCVPAPTQDDPDRKVSFFAAATDVVVPLS